ncbi:TIGR04168 family protein [Leptospira fainei serovar Hurstbridge str. BUT 6]|uniref:TIGR04168 family protein n=1 Tax=Leptospira fainei serovar Hurstbridge str. BUT 6 TaxID=1193011 RepID=S3W6J2_9LEPT|nr:metallophosphoesterase [Leptospira fainei]EPG75772.1 TIGR04168 family protein [Leptospira fainei serovar Hurstbridge str. BUT 6]
MKNLTLALIGDIHGFWTSVDTDYFSHSAYDAILFTGDLGTYTTASAYRVAKEISKIRKPCYLIPGNHDTTSVFQLLVEIFSLNSYWTILSLPAHLHRYSKFRRILGDIKVCEYSLHSEISDLALIGGRPLSMGSRLNFLPLLKQRFGIRSLRESSQKLISLSRDSGTVDKDILILAHNGPAGLGGRATDIWGCDFRKEAGDFGDLDLAECLDTIRAEGRIVSVVAAGHMHHHAKRSLLFRTWKVRKAGTLYVNAARVPRIFKDKEGQGWHHHIRLTRTNGHWDAEAIYLKGGREEVAPLPKEIEKERTRIKEES